MITETQDYSSAQVGEEVTMNGSSHTVLGNEPRLGYLHLSIGQAPALVLYRVLEAAGAVIRRSVRIPTANGSVVEVASGLLVRVNNKWMNAATGAPAPESDWGLQYHEVVLDASEL